MMRDISNYKLVHPRKADGVTAIIAYRKKVLLLKRVNIPFISNPGIWCFPAGKRKNGEEHIDVAYREVEEETGIKPQDLKLISKLGQVRLFDSVNHRHMWDNAVFVFRSKTNRVRLDYENTAYRWATVGQIEQEKEYTNIFMDEKAILKMLNKAIK